ncbi:MAG: FAD:protein FMN transferase [Oscillospiraceae bacterium]|nr:FAD:protein FMN transferase [Oscillospiraceae bacterium]
MISQKRRIIIAQLLNIVILLTIFGGCSAAQGTKTSKSDFVLNTVATITIYGNSNEKIIDECFDLCRHYEALFSRTDENSEICKLNSREISEVSDETADLIIKGLYFGALSGGSFDIAIEPLSALWNFTADSPIVPSAEDIAEAQSHVDYRDVSVSGNTVSFATDYTRLDLGAIAKGYIADKVKELLVSRGVERAIINLGGNVLCIGGKTDTSGFEIGIQYPFSDGSIASVSVSDLSVVTSGTYERYFEEDGKLYHHILDPQTGYPVENNLLSVSIIGESSCTCDALSTSCFALGKEAGTALIESMDGYYAVFITDDYKLYFTEGAQEALDIKY